jgi:hypothetical protein
MKRVGSRYEPVVNDIHKYTVFRLPGAEMTFAAYSYLSPEDDMPLPKYGFFFDDGRFFYVDEIAASDGDARYALDDGYFIVDGLPNGGSGDRSMYLFRYGKDSVKLLDMIGTAWDLGLEFAAVYPGKPTYGHEIGQESADTPVWVTKERDGSGHPLVTIRLYHEPISAALYKFYTDRGIDPDKYEELYLYLKIAAPAKAGRGKRVARLRVSLDPEIYRPLFDSVRGVQKAGVRPAGYYVYGFLAHRLALARIKADLADNKDRKYIVDMLEHLGNWDKAFHDRSGEPFPKIVEYKLKRR